MHRSADARYRVLPLLGLALLAWPAGSAGAEEFRLDPAAFYNTDQTVWVPQVFLGGKVGTERSLGSLDLMVPLTPDNPDLLIYVDGRLRYDDNDTLEYNLGGGVRYVLSDNLIVGGYGFFDVTDTEFDNQIMQVTLGAELLAESWRLRANGYIPEDTLFDVSSLSGRSVEVAGNRIIVTSSALRERALPGFDVEVGYRPFERQEFWVYAKYFHFEDFSDSSFESRTGPAVRADWQIPTDWVLNGSYISIGAEYQHDSVAGDEVFATVFWRLPLGGSSAVRRVREQEMGWRYWSMLTPVVRDVDVITARGEQRIESAGIDPRTGQPYGRVFFVEAGADGAGTEDDPAGIEAAAALAAVNDIIVINGTLDEDDELIDVVTDGIAVHDGMMILGGNSTIMVATVQGLEADDPDQDVLELELDGLAPSVRGTGASVFDLDDGADNVVIANLTISGGTGSAIIGINNENLRLSDITVSDTPGMAVRLENATDLSITKLTVTDAASGGIDLEGLAGEGMLTDLVVEASGGTGVSVTGAEAEAEITFTNLRIETEDGAGLVLADAGLVTITGGSVDAAGGAALDVIDSDLDATFTTLASDESDGVGVRLDDVRGELTVTGATTISDSAAEGLVIRNLTATDDDDEIAIDFGAVTITNSGGTGLLVTGVDGEFASIGFGATTVSTANASTADAVVIRQNNTSEDDLTIELTSLSGTARGGRGLVAADNNGATIRATGGTVSATGGAAIDISDTDLAVSFTTVTSVNSATSGVILNDVTGSFAVTGATTITGATNRGISINQIDDAESSVAFGAVSIDGAGAEGIVVSNVLGEEVTITFGATTVQNTTGAGIDVSSVTGDGSVIAFGATTMNDTGAGGVAVHDITADDARVTFGAMTLDDIGGTGIAASNISGDNFRLTTGAINLTDATGAGLALTNVTGDEAAISTGGITMARIGGIGVHLSQIGGDDAAITTATINLTDIVGDGIVIEDVTAADTAITTGNLTMNNLGGAGLRTDDVTGTGFRLTTGTQTVNNAAGQGLLLTDITGANSTVTTGNVTTSGAGLSGVEIRDLSARVTLGNVSVDNTDGNADGVLIHDVASTVTLGNVTVNGADGSGLVIENIDSTARIVLGNVTANNSDVAGVAIRNLSGNNVDVSINTINIDGTGSEGLSISQIAGDGIGIDIGNVTTNDTNSHGVLISAVAAGADDLQIEIGNVIASDPGATGVTISGIAGPGHQIEIGNITVEDLNDPALVIEGVTADGSIDAGDIVARDLAGDAILIQNNAVPDDYTIDLGDVTLEQPDVAAEIARVTNNTSAAGTLTIDFDTLIVIDDPNDNAAVQQSGNTNVNINAGPVQYRESDDGD